MWIFLWLILGTKGFDIQPVAVSFATEKECRATLSVVEKQVKVIDKDIQSRVWCIEATQEETPLPTLSPYGTVIVPGTGDLTTH
jgi:hypothetical protein